ncbi:MAG: hypothetical protein FJZ92_14355 [Chloroflexi bacterium]|nr:hypothetical protein [Chloroflexota bacterium]
MTRAAPVEVSPLTPDRRGDREAYPVDPPGGRMADARTRHGTLALFASAGFEEVARPLAGRAVVRRTVTGGAPRSAREHGEGG